MPSSKFLMPATVAARLHDLRPRLVADLVLQGLVPGRCDGTPDRCGARYYVDEAALMLYGLPAGLLAGWCPPLAPILMFRARLGTRWVDTVAQLGVRLEPDPPIQFVGWAVVTLIVTLLVLRGRRPRARTAAPVDSDR